MKDITQTPNNKPAEPLPYAHRGDLTNGPISKHLTRMTIPMIWGLFAVIAVQLVDTYFISTIGDTEILAGFSFTFPVTMIISHLVFGINIALSSVTARLIGAKNIQDTKRVVLHGIILAVCLSSIIAFSTFIVLKPLFFAMGADEKTFAVIAAYMPLWLISSIILAIPVNANSAMRAAGDTFMPALVMTSMAIVNAILDPILIFGYFGAPALGVQGAALATLIATIFCTGIAMYFVICKKDMIALDSLHLDKFKDSFKRLVVIAIPAGIGNIIVPITSAIILAILASYGSEAVAAYGVVSRIEAISLILVLALSLGMAPIVGQNWGAGNYERVHEAISLAILVNFIWSILVAIILGIFASTIAGAFSNDPLVLHYCVFFFWVVPLSYGFGNLVFGWGSAFNAMGMPQTAFALIFTKAILITLPAVFIGGWLYGVEGIFVSIALTNLTAGIIIHILSARICKKHEKQQASALARL